MERQLPLLDGEVDEAASTAEQRKVKDWRLDRRTRERGLQGVAAAREALRQAAARSAA
ncbi:MAG: hypothetical protein M0Z87_02710 [Actinomycetota bacterium]|nr:hypothetical protein [Actinomycetota bacterium]